MRENAIGLVFAFRLPCRRTCASRRKNKARPPCSLWVSGLCAGESARCFCPRPSPGVAGLVMCPSYAVTIRCVVPRLSRGKARARVGESWGPVKNQPAKNKAKFGLVRAETL